MVDMIEEWFPESTKSPDNIIGFKQNSGNNSAFMKAWHEGLNDVLEDQEISLDELMSAEMKRERLKSDRLARWSEILRKPEGSITADELEFIKQRIAEKQANLQPGGSSSGAKPGKGGQVGNDAAVGKRSVEASKDTPSDYPPMPRRPTPPIDTSDPPGKRRKGDPKGAAERAPSGSKGAQKGAANRAASALSSGKGKGKWKGEEKGETKESVFELLPRVLMKGLNPCAITLLTCLVLISPLLNEKTKSSLRGILMLISALPIGKGVRMQFPCNVVHLGTTHPMRRILGTARTTRTIANGCQVLGLVIILILRRKTAIVGKMMEIGKIGTLVRMCAVVTKLGTLVWKTAVAAELGTLPLLRQTCSPG